MAIKKFKYKIGVDEAGRGPLAGPVVASCVWLGNKNKRLDLKDSKKISPRKREELSFKIKEVSCYSFGLVNSELIDRLNIFQATQLAFRKAIERFLKKSRFSPEECLFIIDGPYFSGYKGINYKCLVRADEYISVVQAASILAKVLRDSIMQRYDRLYPGWNFSQHKGYPTPEHRRLIRERGVSPLHRLSFKLL